MSNSIEINWSDLKSEDILKIGEKEWEEMYFEARKDDISKEKEKLMIIFGEEAKIEKKYKEGWSIESILKNGEIVPGGQKVKIQLSERMNFTNNIDSYDINSIEINEEKIELPSRVTLYSVKLDINNGEALLGEKIRLFGFKSAEDLIILFHEIGHQFGENYKVGLDDYKSVLESISNLQPEENISNKDSDILLKIFKEENRASSNAVAIIKNLREKGTDLFPDDPSLIYVNLFLSFCMSSYLKNLENGVNLGKYVDNPERFLKFDWPDISLTE